jgi:hypothetical protein
MNGWGLLHTLVVVLGVVFCVAFVARCQSESDQLDAAAPIVETCVKHPVTKKPPLGQNR